MQNKDNIDLVYGIFIGKLTYDITTVELDSVLFLLMLNQVNM